MFRVIVNFLYKTALSDSYRLMKELLLFFLDQHLTALKLTTLVEIKRPCEMYNQHIFQ